jgi:hypothetical protein
VLDVVADYEDAELDEDVTQVLDSGGAQVAPAGVLTLHSALADAITYRVRAAPAPGARPARPACVTTTPPTWT